MSVTAYPLAWPDGWKRHAGERDYGGRFRHGGSWITVAAARDKLFAELERLGVRNVTLSTDIPLRIDGTPRSGMAEPRDPGAAVYFTLRDRPMVMACDRFDKVAANIRSLGLAIEAMRQLERHGGGAMMERAFTGFAALPPPGYKRPWREVLELNGQSITRETVEASFRALARKKHPDRGGSETAMAELNAARADALAEVG